MALGLVPRRKGVLLTLSILSLASWGVEGLSRAERDEIRVNSRFAGQVRRLQGELAALAEQPALRQLLAGTGAEAEPETPFELLARSLQRFPPGLDSLVLVDLRGEPVAWAGPRPRLPLQWRPVGERVCVPEAWVEEVVLWCREPAFESGRVVGSVLAAVAVPAAGARRALGVWAGPSAVLVPVVNRGGKGLPSLQLVPRPASSASWRVSGGALALTPLVFLLAVPPASRAWLALGAGAVALAIGLLPVPLLPALVMAAMAWLAKTLPPTQLVRFGASVVAAVVGWALPPLLLELGVASVPSSLLLPSLSFLASLVAFVAFLMACPPAPRHLPWLCLPFLAAGLWMASGLWLAVGVLVLLTNLGPRHRPLWSAWAAACLFLGGGDGARRNEILAKTEATLARWGEVQRVARALLGALPEGRLEELVQAAAGQRVVHLGELGAFVQLGQVLPGTALVLEDADGEVKASWGETGVLGQGRTQELAVRPLREGWRLQLLAPPSPYHVLAALTASGVGVPLAAFDRAGAPVSRGAPFRPLSPVVVGEALARERLWGRVEVGTRSAPTYLRAYEDWVLAVPWLRPLWPDAALVLAALGVWGAAPFTLWRIYPRVLGWWRERASFTGRLRMLAFTATLVPLAILGNALPAQWAREREQGRAELARTLASSVSQESWQESLENLVRDLGVVVAVYRPSYLLLTSRPDLAMLGSVPLLPDAAAYVRAVRRWFEPLVVRQDTTAVYIPARSGDQPLVFAVFGLADVLASHFHPAEWFAVTGLWAVLLALWAAETLATRLSGPMAQLVDAARRLGQGKRADLQELAPGGDEFATLAQAFTAMAAEVKARQAELERERDLLQRVLENLSAAVLVLQDGKVILANEAAKKIGVAQGWQALRQMFGPSLDPLLSSAVASSLRLAPRGQADALWQVTAVPLSGDGERLLLVLEDLSEVARAERLASLTELARIVAHEVKNPLTPIRLWVEELQAALEKGPQTLAEVARLAVTEILQQVVRLKDVSQGFANLVALERWEPTTVDVAHLAEEVVAEYSILERRGVHLELVRPPGGLPVSADPSWLARALRHLLDNSVKALSRQSGRVTVEVKEEAGCVVLAVRDTAGGVAEEHLPRLFEPHFSATSEGSGLGLAVVRRVCQRAGGRAEARNLAEGLEVRMLLPKHE